MDLERSAVHPPSGSTLTMRDEQVVASSTENVETGRNRPQSPLRTILLRWGRHDRHIATRDRCRGPSVKANSRIGRDSCTSVTLTLDAIT
jgi:hypothetical protein